MFIKYFIENGVHIDELTYNEIIVKIITTVDDFLLGIVLLIFGLGTYDLFISLALKFSHGKDINKTKMNSRVENIKNAILNKKDNETIPE